MQGMRHQRPGVLWTVIAGVVGVVPSSSSSGVHLGIAGWAPTTPVSNPYLVELRVQYAVPFW